MIIAGVDEAGRGPLAGPVVCAAVILAESHQILGLNDSKKLSAKQREKLFDAIQEQALAFSIVFVGPNEIDTYNILQATLLGMTRAIKQLIIAPSLALIDGNKIPLNLPCQAKAIIKGDSKEHCIMAASILAKVSRDRYMQSLHTSFPQYGFAQHKGYPTAQHINAINEYGICPEHRHSYAPVQNAMLKHST